MSNFFIDTEDEEHLQSIEEEIENDMLIKIIFESNCQDIHNALKLYETLTKNLPVVKAKKNDIETQLNSEEEKLKKLKTERDNLETSESINSKIKQLETEYEGEKLKTPKTARLKEINDELDKLNEAIENITLYKENNSKKIEKAKTKIENLRKQLKLLDNELNTPQKKLELLLTKFNIENIDFTPSKLKFDKNNTNIVYYAVLMGNTTTVQFLINNGFKFDREHIFEIIDNILKDPDNFRTTLMQYYQIDPSKHESGSEEELDKEIIGCASETVRLNQIRELIKISGGKHKRRIVKKNTYKKQKKHRKTYRK